MKKISFIAVLALLSSACTQNTSIVWYEGETMENGTAQHRIVVNNPPAGEYYISFAMTPLVYEMGADSQGVIENVCGPLYKVVPGPATKAADSLVVTYIQEPLRLRPWAPEGFYLVDAKGNTTKLDVQYMFQPIDDASGFYDEYAQRTPGRADSMRIIPEVKSIVMASDKGSGIPQGYTGIAAPQTLKFVEGKPAGWYSILLDGKVNLECADEDAQFYALTTFTRLLAQNGGRQVPNCRITDWPDMQYRGLMLDVSRNFTSAENIKKVLDVMSMYKANVFHLHLIDDEGWRLEIKGLPELTQVGAFHRIGDESEALHPSYNGLSAEKGSSSDGYYTREQFIDILQYAKSLHIKVIPEIESPGHARAAIVAMKAYAKRTGDESYLLHDPLDQSVYLSAQEYHDNAMNVASENVYRFMTHVIDDLVSMYREAGVEFDCIHLGGDEVPDGSWMGSPQVKEFMAMHGYTTAAQMKSYFVRRMVEICTSRGLKIGGWQEIAQNNDPQTRAMLASALYGTNFWAGSPSVAADLCKEGYKVIVSNVRNYYFDMTYTSSREEAGATWSNNVNCRTTFELPPYSVVNPSDEDMVAGVQGQLWCEGVRSFDDVAYDLFPKCLGVFERGWNARPAYPHGVDAAFEDFYAGICSYEMPYFMSEGINFRLPPVGMKMVDGKLDYKLPSQIEGAVVRYTTDGTDPVLSSAVLEKGQSFEDGATIKARLFLGDVHSITTTLQNAQ